MANSFPNLIKDMNLLFQRSTNSNRIKAKEISTRHIIMKLSKVKEKETILKTVRLITYKETSIRLAKANFSRQIIEVRRQ